MYLDAHTLGLCLATILDVAIVGSLPAFLRVFRIRRNQQILGWIYWPLLHALDERSGDSTSLPKMAEVVPLRPDTIEPHTA